MLSRLVAIVLSLGLLMSAAMADDWVAIKLRGQVLQLVDGEWQPLKRGDVVPDDRVIRTTGSGRVEFQRDAETISLGPQTQIQIVDKTGQRFTTVRQSFGEVAIEANVENVQHFAVQTPFLAAVVKGTRFVVKSGKNSASVTVQRGRVAVQSLRTNATTLVTVGQTATAGATTELVVSGRGKLPDVVSPSGAVISSNGKPVAGTLVDTVKGTTSAVVGTTTNLVGKTVNVVGDTVDRVGDVTKGTVNTVTTVVNDVTKTTTNTVTGTLKGTLKGTTGLLGGLF